MKVLLTGGAGFIGSNLVESLINNKDVQKVRVLDNFATGKKQNILSFFDNPKFEFIEGDIRDLSTCLKAAENMDAICHQAALGSVPRSINDPLTSHQVNIDGFVNILEAARLNKIKKIVYASSSSVYGDLKTSPKVEDKLGKVLSPYAATKMVNEIMAEAYAKNYGISMIGLRYFNVFGPKQNPNGPYAAVIPIFVQCALDNKPPLINGDGTITRDFTPVSNVLQVNVKALFSNNFEGKHEVFNVACGATTSLNELWGIINQICNINIPPNYGEVRSGDVLFSLADVSKVRMLLKYEPVLDLKEELKKTIDWYRNNDSRKYFS